MRKELKFLNKKFLLEADKLNGEKYYNSITIRFDKAFINYERWSYHSELNFFHNMNRILHFDLKHFWNP